MKYESIDHLSREEASRQLTSGRLDDVRRAVAALPSIDDDEWVLDQLIKITSHVDVWVAGNAVVSLGEMGRQRRVGDVEVLKQKLVQLASTRSELASRIANALADIHMGQVEMDR